MSERLGKTNAELLRERLLKEYDFDPKIRKERLDERDKWRDKKGTSVINDFRAASKLESPVAQLFAINHIREVSIEEGIPELLVDFWQEAAKYHMPKSGLNEDVALPYAGYDQVEDLGHELRIDPAVRQDWAERISLGKMRMILAYDGRIVAGRVNFWPDGPREKEAIEELKGLPWMHALLVTEDQRNKAIGSRLVVECEREVIRSSRMSRIIGLAVTPDNTAAINMYKKFDFNHRKVAGKDTFESLPEGKATKTTTTLLMVKNLETRIGVV